MNKLNIDEIKTSSSFKDTITTALNAIVYYLGANIKNEHEQKIVYVLEWYSREEGNKPY